MQRITDQNLKAVVDRLNRLTGNPLDTYSKERKPCGSLRANIGNFHLSFGYGDVCLMQISNEDGGCNNTLGTGHVPKRELYNLMHAFIRGIEYIIRA